MYTERTDRECNWRKPNKIRCLTIVLPYFPDPSCQKVQLFSTGGVRGYRRGNVHSEKIAQTKRNKINRGCGRSKRSEEAQFQSNQRTQHAKASAFPFPVLSSVRIVRRKHHLLRLDSRHLSQLIHSTRTITPPNPCKVSHSS